MKSESEGNYSNEFGQGSSMKRRQRQRLNQDPEKLRQQYFDIRTQGPLSPGGCG